MDNFNRTIAAKIITSDLLVFHTPVRFSGYSFKLRRLAPLASANKSKRREKIIEAPALSG